ncbi:DNA polymerase III [Actinomadura craniellae]|uniref:DNA polymerase III n=1 Tax=Actinomadura craniellae TaxID=2231787 RepID=A0A365GVQ9_9ACTN|nr:3'-5' exonuclease [Actinomadura craniellae]RAY10890.1 DNA polymerase III [Actinomadura craniellae]
MEPYGRFLNVIDVEATCWDGPVPPGQANEIIEIGLCVIDWERGERVARHQIMVRPDRSRVSPFCTELTGHTQEDVDRGVGFREACAALERDHHARSRPWASWGDYDRKQFQGQCGAARVRYPFGSHHTNAKLTYSQSHGLSRRFGMAGALRHTGLPLEGRHHNGADDAWNIAALILDIAARDAWPAPFQPT